MTVVREPMWDDAPRTRAQGAFRYLVRFLASLGWAARILALSVASFPAVLCRRSGRADFATQLYVTGIRTLPVITVVSLFIGMILALQVGLELRRFNQEIYLGAAVMLTLLREMGPFACGISLAACVGSAIAAELGTMTVNDEVAALEIMSISPIRFLAAPRMLALIVMAPILAFYCSVIGTLGGGIVGSTQLGVDFRQYMSSTHALMPSFASASPASFAGSTISPQATIKTSVPSEITVALSISKGTFPSVYTSSTGFRPTRRYAGFVSLRSASTSLPVWWRSEGQ